ncbi:phosphoglycerate kinase [Candidatus Saccharibacteria bacterium]|nr:phosphoglycerate kinase [Candidatus Saccharibacteria bacterium]
MSSFKKKTVKDVNLSGSRVLLRADYNVPVDDGRITDDYRLRASLPTIQYILKQKPSGLVIASHLGRPAGKVDKSYSLRPVAKRLSQLLDKPVRFVNDCVGQTVHQISDQVKDGQIILLENLRFHPGEEANDKDFAQNLIGSTGAEVFVQDAFGVVHRQHATTSAITKLLPSVAGLLLQTEVTTIEQVLAKPERPLVAVIGGAKIADKIDVIKRFIDIADCLAVGGIMANNFLKAEGYEIGSSLYDKDDMKLTMQLLKLAKAAAFKRPFSLIVPADVLVSKDPRGRQATRIVDLAGSGLADTAAYPKLPKPSAYTVGSSEMILDLGPASAARIAGVIKLAKTVIWNGTMGITEIKGLAGAHRPFSHGTNVIVEAMIGEHHRHPSRPFSLVGGGDTVGYIEQEGLVDDFSFVSTGGGATLDLIAGKPLPGLDTLPNK